MSVIQPLKSEIYSQMERTKKKIILSEVTQLQKDKCGI